MGWCDFKFRDRFVTPYLVFYLTTMCEWTTSVAFTRLGRGRAFIEALVGGLKVPIGWAVCDLFDYDCGVTGTKRP